MKCNINDSRMVEPSNISITLYYSCYISVKLHYSPFIYHSFYCITLRFECFEILNFQIYKKFNFKFKVFV